MPWWNPFAQKPKIDEPLPEGLIILDLKNSVTPLQLYEKLLELAPEFENILPQEDRGPSRIPYYEARVQSLRTAETMKELRGNRNLGYRR